MHGTFSTGPGPVPSRPPANDPSLGRDEITDQLRADHDSVLAELDALRAEHDESLCAARLARLRQSWMVHALAEEAVVYRALESAGAGGRSDERFIEHELVGGLFDKLGATRPGTLEWGARLNVLGDLVRRHLESEQDTVFASLERHFDAGQRIELGERFRLAHDKLLLLERAKS